MYLNGDSTDCTLGNLDYVPAPEGRRLGMPLAVANNPWTHKLVDPPAFSTSPFEFQGRGVDRPIRGAHAGPVGADELIEGGFSYKLR